MPLLRPALLGALAWALAPAPASAAGAAARGQELFSMRCALCHSTGDNAKQGPGLGGVVGRRAGSQPGYTYSRALATSSLVWTAKTLDAYLAAPGQKVPGTLMAIRVTEPKERADLIAYLATLKSMGGRSAPHGRAAPRGRSRVRD